MLTIYQKPTCSTCREVMLRLNAAGVEYDSINYIIDTPSREKLVELLAKMGMKPRDLLRTREPEYRELGLDDPARSDAEVIDAMIRYPGLIQRPIIEFDSTAVLARPAEKVDEIIAAMGRAGEAPGATTDYSRGL